MVLSRSSFGITGSMTSEMIASRSFLVETFRVLRRDDDGLDTDGGRPRRERHLRLTVGTDPLAVLRPAKLRQSFGEAMSELDRHWHQLFGLIAGVAEHHSLIAGSAMIDALSNVWRLLVDRADHRAGLAIEAHTGVVVANPVDRGSHDLRNVDVRLGGDLAGNAGEPGRY
jgi:hypothetical protein